MPIPTAATAQMVAAVVIPLIWLVPRNMTPAPRKPIPVTILEAMRSGLPGAPMAMDMMVKKQEPMEIMIMVRKPADLLRYSLSAPTRPPHSAAMRKRTSIS